MPAAVFSPARVPTSVDRDVELRVLKNEFGDGYEQVVPDGINTVRESLSVKWSGLTSSEAESIESFFTSQAAASFTWTPPNRSAQKLWRCTEWSMADSGLYVEMTAKLTEVFA